MIKKTIYVVIAVLISCFLLEISLRVLGYSVYQTPNYTIQSVPKNSLLPNNTMGINLNPGSYEVSINKKLNYHVTHTSDSLRTSGSNFASQNIKIQIHGCSFTYGMGVNDDETYPFILQQQFPNLTISNYGKPGYGQVQALLFLMETIKKNDKPDYFILNYLPFHDERNTMNTNYRQKIKIGYEMYKKNNSFEEKVNYNYPLALIVNDDLMLKQVPTAEIYNHFPLRNKLAFVNQFENLYNKFEINEAQDRALTKKLIGLRSSSNYVL